MRTTHVHSLDPGTLKPEVREGLQTFSTGKSGFGDLPDTIVAYLSDIVRRLECGETVNVVQDEDLSTTEAAKLLGVSRPFLVKLLERGRIPFHRVGHDRRIAVSDLLAYIDEQTAARSRVADEVDVARRDADARVREAAGVDDDAARLLGL